MINILSTRLVNRNALMLLLYDMVMADGSANECFICYVPERNLVTSQRKLNQNQSNQIHQTQCKTKSSTLVGIKRTFCTPLGSTWDNIWLTLKLVSEIATEFVFIAKNFAYLLSSKFAWVQHSQCLVDISLSCALKFVAHNVDWSSQREVTFDRNI